MKGLKPRICVVGSMITDLVFRVERLPRPGETLPGKGFGMFLGGKGFNQAIAAHRLGAEVTMIGRIGNDQFGDLFLEKLQQEGMSTGHITRDPEIGTGVAVPMIDTAGQNSIIGVPRANLRLTVEQVAGTRSEIEKADVLMLQFEVPKAASQLAAAIARHHGTLVQLDPAPAHHLGDDFSGPLDYIVPNEIEAAVLAQGAPIDNWARRMLDSGLTAVVISTGEQGATVYDRQGRRDFPAFKVRVVDTTGAGDAFRAGLAVMIAEGKELDAAVRFANACGALACTVLGAEPSMPTRIAVEEFLAELRSGDGANG